VKCFVALLAGSLAALGQTPDCSLVPGWTQQGASRSYTGENLFEYMDGNAEGYLVYSFVAMQGVNCESGGETIVFDVSEMADAESAYGMFTATRDPTARSSGSAWAGRSCAPGHLRQGKYFVEIGISKDAPTCCARFAGRSSRRSRRHRTAPDLSLVPAEKLAPETVRLFPKAYWACAC